MDQWGCHFSIMAVGLRLHTQLMEPHSYQAILNPLACLFPNQYSEKSGLDFVNSLFLADVAVLLFYWIFKTFVPKKKPKEIEDNEKEFNILSKPIFSAPPRRLLPLFVRQYNFVFLRIRKGRIEEKTKKQEEIDGRQCFDETLTRFLLGLYFFALAGRVFHLQLVLSKSWDCCQSFLKVKIEIQNTSWLGLERSTILSLQNVLGPICYLRSFEPAWNMLKVLENLERSSKCAAASSTLGAEAYHMKQNQMMSTI